MSSSLMVVRDVLDAASKRLAASGVDSPALSAQLLLGHALGLDRLQLILQHDRPLTPPESEAVQALIARREQGEPVAYILGVKEFYGRDFAVRPGVLVPRPETEHIVEAALEHFDRTTALGFADLGTGSGCLAATLALEFPAARGLALDLSPEALAVARENLAAHAVTDRVEAILGDFARPFAPDASLDLVVANPPYVSQAEYEGLSNEVAGFEPRSALVPDVPGASDGLEDVRRLLPTAHSALRPGGVLLVEIGCRQGPAVQAILSGTAGQGGGARFSSVRVLPDLAGLDRIALAQK